MSKKNVLILGGTGTLSSEVLLQAQLNGFKVTIMTRGLHQKVVPSNVESLKCDFTNKFALEKVLFNQRYDVIVDFLSRKKEDIERVYPIVANKCHQYIFISSACVYRRDNNDFPLIETSPKPNTNWTYNIQKFECENKLKELSKKEKAVYTIIRPYITYDDERLPLGLTPAYHFHRTIIERLRAGKPWIIWDEGKALTTITHANDFARAVVGLFLNPKAYNDDFHITSEHQCSHKELIEFIYKKLNLKPNIISFETKDIIKVLPEYKGLLLGDRSLNAIFDNSKLLSALPGFTFDIDIEHGMERVLSYWDKSKNYDYDYKFEARIDRLVGKRQHVNYIQYKNASSNSIITYYCYRHLPLKLATRLIK